MRRAQAETLVKNTITTGRKHYPITVCNEMITYLIPKS